MFAKLLVAGLVGWAVVTGTTGVGHAAQPVQTARPHASFAPVGSITRVPYGWKDFCGRRPEECAVPVLQPADVHLTAAIWNRLVDITRSVNGAIEPVSNLEHWGTILDHWDYPVDGKGDCKIYALYKRKLLLESGLPRQALLMTIVRDLTGGGHTILTVKTDRGDFVLDNLSDDVRPWDSTGYKYIKRQSQEDPNVWVSLEGEQATVIHAAQ